MKTPLSALIGFFAGFFAGELVAVALNLAVDSDDGLPLALRLMPLYLGLAGLVAGPVLSRTRQGGPAGPSHSTRTSGGQHRATAHL